MNSFMGGSFFGNSGGFSSSLGNNNFPSFGNSFGSSGFSNSFAGNSGSSSSSNSGFSSSSSSSSFSKNGGGDPVISGTISSSQSSSQSSSDGNSINTAKSSTHTEDATKDGHTVLHTSGANAMTCSSSTVANGIQHVCSQSISEDGTGGGTKRASVTFPANSKTPLDSSTSEYNGSHFTLSSGQWTKNIPVGTPGSSIGCSTPSYAPSKDATGENATCQRAAFFAKQCAEKSCDGTAGTSPGVLVEMAPQSVNIGLTNSSLQQAKRAKAAKLRAQARALERSADTTDDKMIYPSSKHQIYTNPYAHHTIPQYPNSIIQFINSPFR